MNQPHDPFFGLDLINLLFGKNRAVRGCITLIMGLVILAVISSILWNILSQSLEAANARQWTTLITMGLVAIYILFESIRYLKSNPIPLDGYASRLPVVSLSLALVFAFLGASILAGLFSSTNSEPPGAMFFLLFYGIPVGSFVTIGMNIVFVLITRKPNWIVTTGTLISGLVLTIFLFWHFLALMVGDYYPLAVDALAFILLLFFMIIFALRAKRTASEKISDS